MEEFRILSLDGGGYRGVLTLAYLRELEQKISTPLIDYFNLLCGTSIGSIVALSIANGKSCADTLDVLHQLAETVFPKRKRKLPWWRTLQYARYDVDVLSRLLDDWFGDATLRDVRVPVCIPSVRLRNGTPRVFKSPHAPEFNVDHRYRLADVALASAAAPTYFAPSLRPSPEQFVDGGLWANNPSIVGVAEAVDLGVDLANIRVLSVGTGQNLIRPIGGEKAARKLARGGLLAWRKHLVPLVLKSHSVAADNLVKKLLRNQNYYRVEAVLHEEEGAFDNLVSGPNLEAYAHEQFMNSFGEVSDKFLATPVSECRLRSHLTAFEES